MTISGGFTRRQAAQALLAGAGALALGGAALAQAPTRETKGGSCLLRGAYVMTLDPTIGDLADADVLVQDGRIAAVGRQLHGNGGETIDARGTLVMPGLVDTHTHMWNSIWRTSTTPYIDNQVKLSPHFRPEDSYNAVKLCAVEMLMGGITTVHAWEHNCRTPDHVDAEIRALRELGVRALYSYGYTHDLPSDELSNLDDILRARRQWQNELLTVGFASRIDGTDGSPASPWPSATPEVRRIEWEFARKEGLPITHHVSSPSANPEPYLALCGPDTLLVHGYQFALPVWRQLARQGVRISLAPYIAATSYRTSIPLKELAESGVRAGVSLDSLNGSGNADMFRTLMLAWVIEQSRNGAPPTFRRMIELATIEGARALGMGEVTGSLTPGKSADLIMIKLDQPNVSPMTSVDRTVIWAVQPANVDTVMVAGRIVKRGGIFRAADARKVAENGARSMKYLLERAAAG